MYRIPDTEQPRRCAHCDRLTRRLYGSNNEPLCFVHKAELAHAHERAAKMSRQPWGARWRKFFAGDA